MTSSCDWHIWLTPSLTSKRFKLQCRSQFQSISQISYNIVPVYVQMRAALICVYKPINHSPILLVYLDIIWRCAKDISDFQMNHTWCMYLLPPPEQQVSYIVFSTKWFFLAFCTKYFVRSFSTDIVSTLINHLIRSWTQLISVIGR